MLTRRTPAMKREEYVLVAASSRNRLGSAPIRPIHVPMWLGAERPGAEAGPAAIASTLRRRWNGTDREHLAARLLDDLHIPVDIPADATERLHRRTLEFAHEIVAVCERLAAETSAGLARGEIVVTLGGDHSVGMGSVAGASAGCDRLGVIWIDSHLDLNTPETSLSGHIHGMSVAASLGYGPSKLISIGRPGSKLDPSNLCYLGVRDIDAGERAVLERHNIWMLTMEEWTDAGIVPGLRLALDHLASRGVDGVHVSFDVDAVDPVDMPGTGTPVIGGLTFREASQVMRTLHAWDGPIRSVDIVELNPGLDCSDRSTSVATSLLATLLGETVR